MVKCRSDPLSEFIISYDFVSQIVHNCLKQTHSVKIIIFLINPNQDATEMHFFTADTVKNVLIKHGRNVHNVVVVDPQSI